MSLVKRNPITGRFESTKNVEPVKAEKVTKKVSAKAKNPKGEMEVKLLINPLAVYSKKAMDGKPSNIKAGTSVQLTPVGDGIRVKKENSSRTFYTTKKAVETAVEVV